MPDERKGSLSRADRQRGGSDTYDALCNGVFLAGVLLTLFSALGIYLLEYQ